MQLPDPPQGLDPWLKILGVGGIVGLATAIYRLWRHMMKPMQEEIAKVKKEVKEVINTAAHADDRLGEQIDTVKTELRKQDSDIRTAQTSMIKDTMRNEEEIKRTDGRVDKLDESLDRTKDKIADLDKKQHGVMKDVENMQDKRRGDAGRTTER